MMLWMVASMLLSGCLSVLMIFSMLLCGCCVVLGVASLCKLKELNEDLLVPRFDGTVWDGLHGKAYNT